MEPQKRIQPAMANDLIKDYKGKLLTSMKKNQYGKNCIEIVVDNYADATGTVLHLLDAIHYMSYGPNGDDEKVLYTAGRLALLGSTILSSVFEVAELADEINNFDTSLSQITTVNENK